MSSDLKPGDRCVIVGSAWAGLNGVICTLIQRDMFVSRIFPDGRSVRALPHAGWYTSADPCAIDERRLIRIPPDSEMRQMFRETERPRERVSEQDTQR